MISRSLAILLAILGLYLSAFAAAAQPRSEGGWRGGGAPGFIRGGGFGGGGRFGDGGRFDGAGRFGGGGRFGAGPGARGFGGPPGGYGRGYAPPQGGGYGGYGAGYPGGGLRGYPPPARAFAGPGRAFGADWGRQQDEVRRAVREGRQIPLGQAIEAVRRRAPGRELDAGLEAGPNGRPVYRLRWAGQNGRRQDYVVDAGTGAVLGVQGGP